MSVRCIAAAALLACAPLSADAQQRDTVPVPDTARVRLESIIISSTRSGRRVEDEPIRVEVVGREEIEEKLLMTPGDIAMLLNETGGVRIQATSPALGGAAVRIQGLRGRYAQVLSDGLPLYGEATGLGALQIPPMDLRQVEVIKGSASALYGAAALGGVINLLSRRPDGERETLLNVTSGRGVDVVQWLSSAEDAAVGWTMLLGVHDQAERDPDSDAWAEVPGYTRVTARPRVFVGDERRSAFVTAGYTVEERAASGRPITGSTALRRINLDTERFDAGIVGSTWWGDRRVSVRGSAMRQSHDHGFLDIIERDTHGALFGEVSIGGATGRHSWVAGAALQRDSYENETVAGFDRVVTTPGIFVQDEWVPSPVVSLSASARLDRPGDHGLLLSPRLSVLVRPGDWSVRMSAGGGHHVPSHWIEDVDAIGLSALAGNAALDVERAYAASLDVAREFGDVEVNVTAFGSRITDAVALRGGGTAAPVVTNVPGTTRTWGGELLARLHMEGLHATASYALVNATEPDPGGGARRDVPLTPRHTAGIVVAREWEDKGRIGAELYYTGSQSLPDDPYRAESRPYAVFGVLAERIIGRVRLFINFENIGDVRQTSYDPFLLPSRSADGRITTDGWAPLDGRVVNGGVRLSW